MARKYPRIIHKIEINSNGESVIKCKKGSRCIDVDFRQERLFAWVEIPVNSVLCTIDDGDKPGRGYDALHIRAIKTGDAYDRSEIKGYQDYGTCKAKNGTSLHIFVEE